MPIATPVPAPVLQFDNLTLGYDRHPAVHHLTGSIAQGALLAIVGPNGGGKSTLLKAIAGTITPLSGKITRSVKKRDIAFLPQAAEIDRQFPISVYDFVAMGLWRQAGAFGGIGGMAHENITLALQKVGLTGFEKRMLGTLSGGQLQRALFARVLLQDASLILLDEPFAAVDEKTSADLMLLLQNWHTEGRSILTVLHDFTLVKEAFPTSLLLARQVIAWGETKLVMSDAHLSEARRMSEAYDPHAEICAAG